MTGFASQTITVPLRDGILTLTMSLKSVNGRFFEATYKMPYPLTQLESEIAKVLKRDLIRGTVFLTIYSPNIALLKSNVQPAMSLIKNYIDALSLIQKTFSLKDDITMHDILQLPNIFEAPEEPLEKSTEEAIVAACAAVIQTVVEDRVREGAALKIDLQKKNSFATHRTCADRTTRS